MIDRKSNVALKDETLLVGSLGRETGTSHSIQRKLPMKYACIVSIGVVATVAAFAWSAAAVENAHELAGYCQSLDRTAKGPGRHIYISRTREALTCWGYMRAMQDLSVLADENGHRIMGAVRRSRRRRATHSTANSRAML
jgi:hypothetical protein